MTCCALILKLATIPSTKGFEIKTALTMKCMRVKTTRAKPNSTLALRVPKQIETSEKVSYESIKTMEKRVMQNASKRQLKTRKMTRRRMQEMNEP